MNRRATTFTRDGGQELTVIPTSGTSAGSKFTVTIDYTGTPSVVTNPDESIEGWVPTDDAAFVVGEPQGSPTWYPCNDNPRDKATFDFSVTVPDRADGDGERRARLERVERRQDDVGLESGMNLTAFFDAWIYQDAKPTAW